MSVGDTFKNSLRNPILKKELKNPISNPRFQKLKTKEGFDLPATAEQKSMHDQTQEHARSKPMIKTHFSLRIEAHLGTTTAEQRRSNY